MFKKDRLQLANDFEDLVKQLNKIIKYLRK